MNEHSRQERVLISFTASWGAEEAIETGVTLAAILGVEVAGLFNQQESVLGLSEFPFSTAHLPGGHQAERITRSSMEQAFQRHSVHCRRLLRERADRLSLEWSYRDIAPAQRVDEAEQFGIQVLSKDRVLPDMNDLLQQIRNVTGKGNTVVVSASRYVKPGVGSIVAIIDPLKDYQMVLRQASRLISAGNWPLAILLIQDGKDVVKEVEADALSLVAPAMKPKIIRPSIDTLGDMIHAVNQLNPAFVVAGPKSDMFAKDADASLFLRSINSAIILVPNDQMQS